MTFEIKLEVRLVYEQAVTQIKKVNLKRHSEFETLKDIPVATPVCPKL